jgi:hypothetical protein
MESGDVADCAVGIKVGRVAIMDTLDNFLVGGMGAGLKINEETAFLVGSFLAALTN